nr:uncharacterized protein LOC109166971 [Ipomoea batatas]
MEYKKVASSTRKCSYRWLAERAELAKLERKRDAQGGHEVGDSPREPLVVLSEGEEVTTALPKEEGSRSHPPDPDYMLFLDEIHEIIDCGSPTGVFLGITLFWEEVHNYPP